MPTTRADRILFIAGIIVLLLGIGTIVMFFVLKQLESEEEAAFASPQIIIELLDEQGSPYRGDATFSYQVLCETGRAYHPNGYEPMGSGRAPIPIPCPGSGMKRLTVAFQLADQSCIVPAQAKFNLVSGMTIRYQISCGQ